jgi:pimeloyl-ACP methyl ester carboxylesterase
MIMSNFIWNNHTIFYRDKGQGPLLVILPGNTASSAAHQPELDRFASDFHTAGIDFLGTGQSQRISPWPVDWWLQGAFQVEALIDHLGHREAILLGTSGGGIVALLAAIHFPAKIKAVIADSCVQRFTSGMARHSVVEERALESEEQVQFWSAMHGDDWRRVVAEDTDMIVRFAQEREDCFEGKLPSIVCPSLLTFSKKDSHLPGVMDQALAMAIQIPDCSLYIDRNGEHPLMWTEPDGFWGQVEHFLQRLDQ